MLKLLATTSLAAASAFSAGGIAPGRAISRSAISMASFHDFSATSLGGKELSMADFKGKPVLILNVASL
ncbi:hypothetical protein AB1Y20_021877 [Prymnesium parvum]|uniref:Glutathione peroxidase n=1 Tax=Prymnesium parvum TaxID=97485 RepID=A0AB34JNL6_PRYPA